MERNRPRPRPSVSGALRLLWAHSKGGARLTRSSPAVESLLSSHRLRAYEALP